MSTKVEPQPPQQEGGGGSAIAAVEAGRRGSMEDAEEEVAESTDQLLLAHVHAPLPCSAIIMGIVVPLCVKGLELLLLVNYYLQGIANPPQNYPPSSPLNQYCPIDSGYNQYLVTLTDFWALTGLASAIGAATFVNDLTFVFAKLPRHVYIHRDGHVADRSVYTSLWGFMANLILTICLQTTTTVWWGKRWHGGTVVDHGSSLSSTSSSIASAALLSPTVRRRLLSP